MAKSVTLSYVKTAAQRRADMLNSAFIETQELTDMVNSSYAELYDLLTTLYGNDYYATTSILNFVNGQQSYTLPSDFYKLLGVDLKIDATRKAALKPFMFPERNRYQNSLLPSIYGFLQFRYRLNGNNIIFTPVPDSAREVTLWYIPVVSTLVNEGDTFDGVNGYEEYIIIDVARKLRIKEESDVSELMADKAAMITRINDSAQNRDAGMPERVMDVQTLDFAKPFFDI